MKIRAVAKSVKMSPRKLRLVTDAVSKMSITNALDTLSVSEKRAGKAVKKTLQSALANAKNNNQLEETALFIDSIQVTEGPVLKRFRPSTRGRIHPYKKRSSHITIVLADKASRGQVEKGGIHGTKS